MTRAGAHLLFIVAAYAVPVLLLGIEIWQLARRSRRQPPRELADEA
jgi:heme exporter protein CcmD